MYPAFAGMDLGPISIGAFLGAIATVASLYYRYVWGAKSQITLSRFTTVDDSEWRDVTTDDVLVWARRILIKASNDGWRTGIINGVSLDEATVYRDGGYDVISNPGESIHKIVLEQFSKSGETTRINLNHRTNFSGQNIHGRDDDSMAILPFIVRDSELGKKMKEGDRGKFVFSFTIEDNKRVYTTSVDIHMSLVDSAGGELQQSV